MLLREVFSCGRVFIGVRLWYRFCFIVAANASKFAVSWEMLLCKVFSYGRVYIRVRLRDRLPLVVGKDGSKQLCCFMPKNWACSFNFSCHISHFWLIWLILLREVFSYERVFIRVCIKSRLYFVETAVCFLTNTGTKTFIRIKNENTTDFSSSIGNRNCHSSFYYWEIWDLRLKF